MGKPFQFSLGNMMCGVAWFSVAALFFSGFLPHVQDKNTLLFLLAMPSCAAAGAGVGAIAGDAREGAWWGFVCSIFVVMYLFMVFWVVPHH
jgi:hypothetical protein